MNCTVGNLDTKQVGRSTAAKAVMKCLLHLVRSEIVRCPKCIVWILYRYYIDTIYYIYYIYYILYTRHYIDTTKVEVGEPDQE